MINIDSIEEVAASGAHFPEIPEEMRPMFRQQVEMILRECVEDGNNELMDYDITSFAGFCIGYLLACGDMTISDVTVRPMAKERTEFMYYMQVTDSGRELLARLVG